MATFPLLYPVDITPTTERLMIVTRGSMPTSAFNGHQTVVNNYASWTLELGFFRMRMSKAENVLAFFDRMMGSIGSFSYLPRASIYPVAATLRLASPAYATSTIIGVKGWASGAATGLRNGQYVQIGTQLHRIMVPQVVAGSGGTATVEIYPPIRSDRPTGTLVETANPRGVFRLAMAEEGLGYQLDPDRVPELLTLRAVEVI